MFIIFAGDHYYPAGGLDDLKENLGRFKTLADAQRAVATLDCDWWQIAQITDGELLFADSGSKSYSQ